MRNDPVSLRDALGFTDVIIGVHRETSDNISTIGQLTVGDQAIGVTLELPYRNNQKGVSAIPEGNYPASVYKSPHLGYNVMRLQGVLNRDAIEIHKGNVPGNSAGCILVGKTALKDRIVGSTPAFNQLMSLINVTQAFDAAIGESTDIGVNVTSQPNNQ